MKLIDQEFGTPAEDLAFDEALLDWGEENGGQETLRLWEAREYFVVVGYANQVEREVNVAACEARNIPILRRCSGGGTVVQGPGCLNYALVLRIQDHDGLASISAANRLIMERNREAIEAALGAPRQAVAARGHTDLAIGGRKFSGNSQRRRREFLLFHGTFLLSFNLDLVSDLLPMPSRQPTYRQGRAHNDFLANLNLTTDQVKTALRRAWSAESVLEDPPLERARRLAREKYATPQWNRKF